MAFTTKAVQVGTTATELVRAQQRNVGPYAVMIANEGTSDVRVGGPSVTATSGFVLPAGAEREMTVLGSTALWAVAAAGTATVLVVEGNNEKESVGQTRPTAPGTGGGGGSDTPTPFAELPYETLPDPDRPAGARATIHWEGYRRGDVVELTLSGTTWTTGFGPLPEEFRPLRAKQFDVIGSHPFTGETVRVQGAVGDHGYVSMFNGIDPTDGTMFQVELMWIAANPF